MTKVIKIAIMVVAVIVSPAVSAYEPAEEIKKSGVEIERLIKVVSKLDKVHKIRVILDVSGGINILLKKTYKDGDENDYQLTYSFALNHLATLAEQMGFHKATACHTKEAVFMFNASQIDREDFSKMPTCRLNIYDAGARANAIMLLTKKDDEKYNTMAGGLIKQIVINSYYTTKILRSIKK